MQDPEEYIARRFQVGTLGKNGVTRYRLDGMAQYEKFGQLQKTKSLKTAL